MRRTALFGIETFTAHKIPKWTHTVGELYPIHIYNSWSKIVMGVLSTLRMVHLYAAIILRYAL